MKRFLPTLSAVVVSGAIALAASLPNVPSSPTYSEASQIVGTLNALIQQLNGGAGYAGAAQNISLGSFCQNAAAGATPQVCNGQRGQVAYTGLVVAGLAATGTTATLVVTDSSVLANSQCTANFITAFTAGSAIVPATAVATAGSVSFLFANAGTTTNAVTTGTMAFNCI
jgi:hypothetical protein